MIHREPVRASSCSMYYRYLADLEACNIMKYLRSLVNDVDFLINDSQTHLKHLQIHLMILRVVSETALIYVYHLQLIKK